MRVSTIQIELTAVTSVAIMSKEVCQIWHFRQAGGICASGAPERSSERGQSVRWCEAGKRLQLSEAENGTEELLGKVIGLCCLARTPMGRVGYPVH